MVARAGLPNSDLEFVQFHPTAIDIGRDPAPLATEALRGEGAVLIDRNGHRFMNDVHELAELASRDVVARAVHAQNLSGAGAYLDAREAVGAAFPDHFPAVFAACMSGGVDPRTDPIPVAPAAHYHMGGVETDLDGFTGVPGLWAVGECASTGVHGANRLASNSLLEGLVFGHRAADAIRRAPTRTVKTGEAKAPPALPHSALQTLRANISAHAGVIRDAEGLSALSTLIHALEAEHGAAPALVAARFLTQGALAREESRGGHSRTDFPHTAPRGGHTRLKLADLYPAQAKLRQALDQHQLILEFQALKPVASVTWGDHIEILCRIPGQEPDDTTLLPGQFLPLAERFDLAKRLDRQVIRQALDWLGQHRLLEPRLKYCGFNLSLASVLDDTFADFMEQLLAPSPFRAECFCLEIREAHATQYPDEVAVLCDALHRIGCRVALEGAGASVESYSLAAHLPVDIIKIDQSFVRNMLEDASDHAIVESVIFLAQRFAHPVLAEGVETRSQYRILANEGFDEMQGYLLGRPSRLIQPAKLPDLEADEDEGEDTLKKRA